MLHSTCVIEQELDPLEEEENRYSDILDAPGGAFFELYNGKNYFYTINSNEAINAINIYGYIFESSIGYIDSTQQLGTVPLYRLHNKNNIFYTANRTEMLHFTETENYECTGIEGYVYRTRKAHTKPLYRLYLDNKYCYTTASIGDPGAIEPNDSFLFDGIVGYIHEHPVEW
ncbi:MAG: hypothetical protein GY754_01340 [bacterium]|nr:hypothetical protein [bacterium]